MNTHKNNKIIAEFMGVKLKPNECGRLFRYHKEWNWLMPVVEKITQETKEFKEGHIDSCFHTPLASALIRFTDRELVYEAVVEFIQEYRLTPKEVC